jgi:uncharacterized UPF0160 family protein
MNYKRIGTHNGDFHLDELTAVSILRKHNPDLEIVRIARDADLSWLDARVDVGGRYCFETNDFDHHQKGGAGKRENGVPYASAGLVWKHFGEPLCDNHEAWNYVDKRLIQYIDDYDNGERPDGNIYGLSTVIGRFNISRNVRRTTAEESFNLALEITNLVLENEIISANEQVKSNAEIRSSLNQFRGLPYIILSKDTGWQDVLVEESDKLYALYQGSDENYRIRAAPKIIDGFENRKSLPEKWRGLKSEELARITGINDFLFCHSNGFIASVKTLESAVKIAKIAASLID